MSEDIFEEMAKSYLGSKTKAPSGKIAGYRPLTRTTGNKDYDQWYDEEGRKNDIDPNLLFAQGFQESRFNPKAVSSAGARGIAQFMGDTAKEFGVNPNDPRSSINGQARLMRQLLDRTNDIDLALAGYNSGHNASIDRLRRNKERIPETRDYVARIRKNYDKTPNIDPFEAMASQYLAQPVKPQSDPFESMAEQYLQSTSPAKPVTEKPETIDAQTPVPEKIETLDAQFAVAKDPANKARTSVFFPNDGTNRALQYADKLDAKQWGLFPDKKHNGTHLINLAKAKKLKLRTPKEIQEFIDKNPNAFKTLGIAVEDVGNDTQGVAITAENNGVEHASAVVRTPETAVEQINAYQKQFPDATIRPTTTDEIVQNRIATLGGTENVPPSTEPPMTVAGELISDPRQAGKTRISQAEQEKTQDALQARFAELRKTNPSLTVDQFNKILSDEHKVKVEKSKQEWLAKNPALAKFAKEKNLDPFAQETVNEYNTSRKKYSATKSTAKTQFDEASFNQANKFLREQGQPELSREEFIARQEGNSKVGISLDPNTFTVDGTKITDYEIEAPAQGGGTIRFPREVGKGRDANGTVAVYRSEKGMSEEDAYRAALLNAGSRYGITPEQVNAQIDKLKSAGKNLFQSGKHIAGNMIAVTWDDLANVGVDVNRERRMEQSQNTLVPAVDVGGPQLVTAPGGTRYAVANKDTELPTLGEFVDQILGDRDQQNNLTEQRKKELEYRVGETQEESEAAEFRANVLKSALANNFSLGESEVITGFGLTAASYLSWLGAGGADLTDKIDPFGVLSGSIVTNALFGRSRGDFLGKFGNKVQKLNELSTPDNSVYKIYREVGNVAGALPAYAAVGVAVGGNPVLTFALTDALVAKGKGGSLRDTIGAGAKGAVMGAMIGNLSRFGTMAADGLLGESLLKVVPKVKWEKSIDPSVRRAISRIWQADAIVQGGGSEAIAAKKVIERELAKSGLTLEQVLAAKPGAVTGAEATAAANEVANKLTANTADGITTEIDRLAGRKIARGIIEYGVPIGLATGIGYGVSAIEGGSTQDNLKNALLFGAMQALGSIFHKKKGEKLTPDEVNKADGTVVRVPDEKGKPHDLILLKENNELTVTDVTGKVPPEAIQGAVLPKPPTPAPTDGETLISSTEIDAKDKADATNVKMDFEAPVETKVEPKVAEEAPVEEEAPRFKEGKREKVEKIDKQKYDTLDFEDEILPQSAQVAAKMDVPDAKVSVDEKVSPAIPNGLKVGDKVTNGMYEGTVIDADGEIAVEFYKREGGERQRQYKLDNWVKPTEVPVEGKTEVNQSKALRELGYTLPMQKKLSEAEKQEIVDKGIRRQDAEKKVEAVETPTQPPIAEGVKSAYKVGDTVITPNGKVKGTVESVKGDTLGVAWENAPVEGDITETTADKVKPVGESTTEKSTKPEMLTQTIGGMTRRGYLIDDPKLGKRVQIVKDNGELGGTTKYVDSWKPVDQPMRQAITEDIYEQAKDDAGRIKRGDLKTRRFDTEVERGRVAGGQRNVEASLILAADARASEKANASRGTGVDSISDTVRRQENILENYAKRNDIWFKQGHFPDRLYIDKGGEAIVYRKDENRVVKLIDPRQIDKSLTPQAFLDTRVTLFNYLFPESRYEVMGFMRDDNGKFRVIVTQPFIQGEPIKNQSDVDAFMKGRGLTRSGRQSYSNKLYEVHDLHEKNVIKGNDGTIYVLDAVPKLVNKDLYPALTVEPVDQPMAQAVDNDWQARVERELADVKEVRNDKGQLLAPNGKPSNLNELQWKQVRTPSFIEYFGDWINDPENASKVVDENGEPLVVYHGTTHDFDVFDPSKGNIEGHLGRVIYLTDSSTDIAENYAGEGPDLTGRIERRAEQILNDRYISGWDSKSPEYKQAIQEARKEIAGQSEGVSMPLYANIKKPLDLTDDNPTRFDALEQYDEKIDEYTENEDSLPMKLYNALQEIANFGAYDGFDAQQVWNDIAENIDGDWDGVKFSDVDTIMRKSEGLVYATDENGDLASSEILSDIYGGSELGFDGVIIDADKQFGSQRQYGKAMSMDEGTKHYHVFNPNQIKSAIGNRGTFDANEDSILKRTPNKEDIKSFENAKTIPARQLIQDVDFNKNARVVEDGVVAVDEIREVELIRRLINEANGTRGGAFYGVFNSKKLTKKFLDTLTKKIKSANEKGIDTKQLKTLKMLVTNASKQDGTVIFAMDEAALTHEKVHRALNRYQTGTSKIAPDVQDAITNSPIFKKVSEGKWGRAYATANPANKVEEFITAASTLDWDALGIKSEADKRAAMSNVIDYYNSYAETNKGEGTAEEVLNALATEIAYVKEITNQDQKVQADEGTASEADGDSSIKDAERKEDRPDVKTESQPVKLKKGEALASMPKTLRKYGLDAIDVAYTVYGHQESTDKAIELFKKHGIDGGIKFLSDVAFDDPAYTVLSGLIYDTLLNQSLNAQGQEAIDLRQKADNFLIDTSKRVARAGAIGEAVKIMQHAPVVTVVANSEAAVEARGGTLSPEQIKESTDLGRDLEDAFAERQFYKKDNDRLRKQLADLEKEMQAILSKQQKRTATRYRSTLARNVKEAHQDEIAKAASEAQAEIQRMVTRTDEPMLMAVGSNTDKLVEMLSKVTAGALVDGIANNADFLPETIQTYLETQYGTEVIAPIFQEVYAEGMKLRDKWIKEESQKRSRRIIENKLVDPDVKAAIEEQLKRPLPENLSDKDILDIMGVSRDNLRRQRALEQVHRYASGVRKSNVSPELRQVVADTAQDPITAVGAILHAEITSPKDFNRAMMELSENKDIFPDGYSQKAVDKAFVDGQRVLSEAKELIKEHQLEIKQEKAALSARVRDAEIAEHNAKERLNHTKSEIARHLYKLSHSKIRYTAHRVWEILPDTLRNMTLSAEASFLMRQGGKFMRSDALTWMLRLVRIMESVEQDTTTRSKLTPIRASLKTMLPKFKPVESIIGKYIAGDIGDDAFGRQILSIENDPDFDAAVADGVDFSTAGKIGSGLKLGEEQLQSEGLEILAKWSDKLYARVSR